MIFSVPPLKKTILMFWFSRVSWEKTVSRPNFLDYQVLFFVQISFSFFFSMYGFPNWCSDFP
jgi:hypothetical protein